VNAEIRTLMHNFKGDFLNVSVFFLHPQIPDVQ